MGENNTIKIVDHVELIKEPELMSKEAAIIAMEQGGYKVTHRFFSEGEYIWSADEDYFIDEEGLCLPKKDFWACRQGKEWETGWRIVG